MQLQQWQSLYGQLGVGVAAFTIDSPRKLGKFADKFEITYPLLRDRGSRLTNKLGIRNKDYRPDEQAFGVPHPGVLYLGPDGRVLGKAAERGYQKRPSFRDLARMIIAAQKAEGWPPVALDQ